MKFMSILVIFAMLFGGTGISVAAAQSSSPGDMLYPVKIAVEELQIELCNCVQNQFKFAMMFTQRRYEEIHAILVEDLVPPNKLMLQYQNQVKYMLQLALKLEKPEEGLQQVANMLQTHQFQMEQLQNHENIEPIQYQMQFMLQYYQELVEEGQHDPNALQHALKFEYKYQLGESMEPIQNQEAFQFQFQQGPNGPNYPVEETITPPVETEVPPVETEEPVLPDPIQNKGKGGN